MKKLLCLLLSVIFLGCNNTATQNGSPANAASATATVKIFKDDKLLVEYKPVSPQGVLLTYKSGEKEIKLNFGSSDNMYALIATVEKTASGNYSIGKEGLGQASVQLTTDVTAKGVAPVPFLTNLTEGTFTISLTGETGNGSFTGSQKEAGLDSIKITAEFSAIPITKQSSDY